MTYLLDTNACVELLNERDTLIAQKLARVVPQAVVVCSVSRQNCTMAHTKATDAKPILIY